MSVVRRFAVSAMCAGMVLTGVAVATPASAAPGDVVVINCLGKGVVKPKQIVLTCADAGVILTGISWSSWTANTAKGTGTLAWNTCLPETCSAESSRSTR